MEGFASLDLNEPNIPYTPSTTSDNALGLNNPDGILTGSMRGTQQANQFIATNPADKSRVGIGLIPGSTTGEYGFFVIDASNNIIQKIVSATRSVYDIANNKNVIQDGKLPDNTYGYAVAKTGKNVSDIFS
jgi:hypothetical protein